MCGRFTFVVDMDSLRAAFPWLAVPGQLAPRFNIAPTQDVPTVANSGRNTIEFFRWGLVPHWAKDPKIGSRMINARSETLAEKPSFRTAYRRRRCLILADGFYEWRKDMREGKVVKTPMYIRMRSGEPFAFAGLWETWRSPEDDTWLTCTIITTTPNSLLEDIHNRMPVILKPDTYEQWLDPAEQNPSRLQEWLKPYPASQMTAYPISTFVNSPANDSPACIAPAA